MKFNYLELANTIKERRLEMGISTRQLAEKIGISHAEISRFENGLKANIYLVPFVNMCKELDIDLFNLLEDTGLYSVGYNKLYEVHFISKKEQIFKIHARNQYEAIRLAMDFVLENQLIEIDENKKFVDIGVAECEEDIDEENEEIDDEEEDFDEESIPENPCEECKNYCPYCGNCLIGD